MVSHVNKHILLLPDESRGLKVILKQGPYLSYNCRISYQTISVQKRVPILPDSWI